MQLFTSSMFTDRLFGKCLLLMLLCYCISPLSTKATITPLSFVVSGTVTNEKDEPLPGSSVRIKGSAKGITTDMNGKFMIEVEREEDSLVVSFVGYKNTTILVGHQRTVIVKLLPDEESQKLNEVQVVGFGTQRKSTM